MAVKPVIGIVQFPGTNCERETVNKVEEVGGTARVLWHEETSLQNVQAVIVPGGFSYGDYLRAGVIARTSPIMDAVKQFAAEGNAVLGICNGFQILTEAGLLPGALLTNASLTFVHKWQRLSVARQDTRWWNTDSTMSVRFPIAHHQGNYYIDEPGLAKIKDQVLFHYELTAAAGSPDFQTDDEIGNPNGSVHAIAGVCNQQGNVLGMMPHPERAMLGTAGKDDGRILFDSLIASLS